MYTVSNISAVVELSRVERRARLRARWPQTRGGRKLGRLAYVLCLLFYGYGLLPSLCCYSVGACGSPTPLSAAGFRRADTSPGRKYSPSRKIQAKNFLMWIGRHQFFSFSSLIPIILSHALLYIRELPLLNEPKKLDQSSTHQ